VARAYAGEPALSRSSCGDRVFETSLNPDRDSSGNLVGISGISVDVTERVRAEVEQATLRDALERAAHEWRTTFDTIDSPVLVVGSDGRVRRANRSAQRLWGEPFDRIVGSPLPPQDRGAPWGAIRDAAGQSLATGALTAADESGTDGKRHWDVVAVPLSEESGGAQGIVAVARDVSRIVALQESLRRSERMSVLGQLVGGVAHQVRNPLFGISSTLDAFDAEFEGRPELAEYSQLLRHETNRLSRLMNDLLEYGKPAPVTLEHGSLEGVLKSAVQATAAVAEAAGVALAMTVEGPLPPVRMEPLRLQEAFHNLIENAIQHSPRHSEVRVWARINDGALPDAGVLCGVDDSGPGFRSDDIPRLFEPFFSRRSGGTGLGLCIAQRVVEEHMGSIVATNLEGNGGRVAIHLPTAADFEEAGARDA
jgi:signal transduction histidine kinase